MNKDNLFVALVSQGVDGAVCLLEYVVRRSVCIPEYVVRPSVCLCRDSPPPATVQVSARSFINSRSHLHI